MDLLIPTLRQWASSDSQDATPERWLGFATADCQHFANALAVDLTDDVSRYQLVLRDLNDVDYQCHHFPDYFIGEIGTAIETWIAQKKWHQGFPTLTSPGELQSRFFRTES
jgi:hypothetical protein